LTKDGVDLGTTEYLKKDYSLINPNEESKELDFERMRRNCQKNFEQLVDNMGEKNDK